MHADNVRTKDLLWRKETVDGVLPVAAVSGSLPWRSASSHWYKAMDESHAEKHGAQKEEKGVMSKRIHKEKQINKCMRMSRAWT